MKHEKILHETKDYVITYIETEENNLETTHLFLNSKKTKEKIEIASCPTHLLLGMQTTIECNENAIAIINNYDNEKIIKKLIYLPTVTILEGNNEQLLNIYNMLFLTKDEKTELPKLKIRKLNLKNDEKNSSFLN